MKIAELPASYQDSSCHQEKSPETPFDLDIDISTSETLFSGNPTTYNCETYRCAMTSGEWCMGPI